MDRELLIEIGCEEIPAGWLPNLTAQMAQHVDARLKEARLTSDAPAEAYSTPRRLTARVIRVAERQTDFEELVTGPPVSAAYKPDGEPTPAATGFAKKYSVEMSALERQQTPKGEYLAYRVRQRGKATVDVLSDVMAGVLRDMTFPKQMRWDAYLEDGKGDLVFARPIRWLVLLYGGRVVPFVIRRTEQAQGPTVQDIRSGPNTYGHRFQTTSGRAGRAIKVKTFDDYQERLLENFVILDRREREQKIRRELETHARRLGGRVSANLAAQSALLREVPDLVEYPAVIAGHIPVEFLQLPEEVLTTTMIHHQHYFPVVDEDGKLKPAFLAVTNMEAEKPEIIARNSERVLTARLRDARFFYDGDRQATLESRIDRLSTILFHKKLGTYKEKADRVASLAAWIATEAFGQPGAAAYAEQAGRLCKADLATDMVRELTELQGTMGGIYAREEGLPEQICKAIYFHYLPIGVEADAPPTRQQLGSAAVVVGGSVACRQARLGGRHVHGRGAAHWFARSVGPPAPGTGCGEDSGGPPGVDRSRQTVEARRAAGTSRGAIRRVWGFGRAAVVVHGRSPGISAERARVRRAQRARGDARRRGRHQPARSTPEARSAHADDWIALAPGSRRAAQACEEHLQGRGHSSRPAKRRWRADRASGESAGGGDRGRRADDSGRRRARRLPRGICGSRIVATGGCEVLR